jgi:hypothetical protein
MTNQKKDYPLFDLERLLRTVFDPKKGEKLCIMIDLENPTDVTHFAFVKNEKLPIQKKAYEVFYQGLQKGVMNKFQLGACDFYAYKMTGGSNLELPASATDPDGKTHAMEEIYKKYDLILCIGNYSATAPLTAAAKKYGFRGATMHGMNDVILKSGLSVDYNEVSRETELLRKGMTRADYVDVEFQVDKKLYHLHIDLKRQEAQKSHGICHIEPDVANLPAGEVYFVPRGAKGEFPIKFEEDGTLGLMHVENCKVNSISLIKGNQKTVDKYLTKFKEDPAAGILGELGFGTQPYPYAAADIQDEKIFGTFHIATGRNDHLTGDVTIDKFNNLRNASHDDILFSSTKTPEIKVNEVRMHRFDKDTVLIKNYEPTSYLNDLLKW